MKSARTSIIVGIALMASGFLLLLDLLGYLDSAALVWPLFFAAAGVVFVVVFFRSRGNWWAAIPGSVFLGLASVTLVTQLWPGRAGTWAGAFLFLFMGAGFGAVYLRERSNWWALIPGGVMLTLALVVALPQSWQGMPVAAVLFLGLAATFAGLSLVPVQAGPGLARQAAAAGRAGSAESARMKWPLIPAAVLAVLGVVFAVQATALLTASEFFVPVFLVLAGVALLVYAFRHRSGGRHGVRGA
ncbi:MULTISPECIES: hypothetical protein [unclassified Arthrobacter]|uniref:hypothetical protein n=1 Tax=unclassified Arthrobacter TaxID=235627 RepID=UPI001CFFC1A8|nr:MULTISPECIES: hypothetical protein [unclassified Arthrobacter]MCB5282841.1 hypothetical protein [Arthrobacter sp. ES1]MDD1476524.1 hypothetical protein [Arthrobacter sp. H16F315]WGZ78977.1 hypothetical protein QI450_14115 [Arthrobacter sp. EM1]